MIIPSIDIMNGQAVQLVQGRRHALDGGDPLEVMRRFRVAGPVAVIDLDAALGKGDNSETIRRLIRMGRCRVGGGIRSVEKARDWLDAGADQVILGTAARPEVLQKLPPERTMAALDAWEDEVVVEGWAKNTGVSVEERMDELRGLVGGFLVTFVEGEGGLGGLPVERVRPLVDRAGPARLTVAGGIASAQEVGEIDRLGADAQVGMALYTGGLSLGAGIAACLRNPGEIGLWPTVVVDDLGQALGLVWSSKESLELAVEERRGVYQSRRRGLWRKGETSGSVQELLEVALDCDRDALRFTVLQEGTGFCHTGDWSCFSTDRGWGALTRRLGRRAADADPESYTKKLLQRPELLRGKLLEEAEELSEAEDPESITHEAADLLYFASVALVRGGIDPARVLAELDRRRGRARRRTASVPRGMKP